MARFGLISLRTWRGRLLSFAIMCLCLCGLRAQQPLPRPRISVLTCSPGQEVYSLYGHTALRVQVEEKQLDWVFNYGVFDFQTPNFMWRFVLGQTDYMLQAYPFEVFMEEYRERGSEVCEQQLSLTNDEANRLFALLVENARPENRVYRYNFLTNNCTSRVRDIVEQTVDGEVVYEQTLLPLTYRTILHQFSAGHPWAQDGSDILLGADCDTLLTDRASMFIPSRYMAFLREAMVFDEMGNRRPLVLHEEVLLPLQEQVVEPEFPLSPLQMGWLFFGVCLLLFALERWVKRMMFGVDLLLMLAHGAVGALLVFMFLCSEHPTLDSNWLVIAFNPLPWLAIPRVMRRAWNKSTCLYHYVAAAVLLLFAAFMPWMPQHFPVLALPVVLGLLSRHVSYYLYYRRTE